MLAAISGNALLTALIWIVVAGLIYWLLDWAITKIGIPQPFAKIAHVVLIILVVLMVINALLMLVGHPLVTF
jgi:hypothetical protein